MEANVDGGSAVVPTWTCTETPPAGRTLGTAQRTLLVEQEMQLRAGDSEPEAGGQTTWGGQLIGT